METSENVTMNVKAAQLHEGQGYTLTKQYAALAAVTTLCKDELNALSDKR